MIKSSLAHYVFLSPHCNYRGEGKVKKITIHHAAGVVDIEGLGRQFAEPTRWGSSNYGIGNDGRIGLYVSEDYRAWTSGNFDNDYQAITIEVSNSEVGGEWPVSSEAFNSLIDLCVDICKRNNIKELEYTGNEFGNLTMHKWFQATACPGPYLEERFPLIADMVNERLKGEVPMTSNERKEFELLKELVNDLVGDVDKLKDQVGIRWAYVDKNLPEFATPTIKKLVNKGLLKGNGDNSYELSYLMLRLLVILDRAGNFD